MQIAMIKGNGKTPVNKHTTGCCQTGLEGLPWFIAFITGKTTLDSLNRTTIRYQIQPNTETYLNSNCLSTHKVANTHPEVSLASKWRRTKFQWTTRR